MGANSKAGRNPKEPSKTKRNKVKVGYDDEEFAALKANVGEAGTSRAAFVRAATTSRKIRAGRSIEAWRLNREAGLRLERMIRQARVEEKQERADELEEVKEIILAAMQKLS